nr:hypothetical protein [Desulfurococcus mucosus]
MFNTATVSLSASKPQPVHFNLLYSFSASLKPHLGQAVDAP